jgi:hypothetical protein
MLLSYFFLQVYAKNLFWIAYIGMSTDHTAGTPSEGSPAQKPEHKKYVFFIGKEKYETEKAQLTVRDILVDFAKVDPAKKSLALKKEGGFDEYTNLDEVIDLKEGMHFVLFDTKPTPVS